MFKKFSILFLSLMFLFSVVSTSTSFAEDAINTKYNVKISATKTVRTHPEAFPADIALAMTGLGGSLGWFTISKGLSVFLSSAGLGSTIVSRTDTTTYSVTQYAYFLKKPTSTSAGYYKYRIKNNKTGKVEFTRAYNIGKNGAWSLNFRSL